MELVAIAYVEDDPAGLEELLSRDGSFLLTSVDSLFDANSDFRVVAWDAQTIVGADSDYEDTVEQDSGKPEIDHDRVTTE